MWQLNYEESWALKNWCFWTVVLEKTLESPLDYKEIQPVHPKGDQSWVFIGRSDFEAETPKLWPPDTKSWLIGKDPDAGEDWGQEEKGMTEDEMVGWHHQLNGHGFGWTPGVGDGQGGLLRFMGSQRVRHDWATELNWIDVTTTESSWGPCWSQRTCSPCSATREAQSPQREEAFTQQQRPRATKNEAIVFLKETVLLIITYIERQRQSKIQQIVNKMAKP